MLLVPGGMQNGADRMAAGPLCVHPGAEDVRSVSRVCTKGLRGSGGVRYRGGQRCKERICFG